MLWLAHNVWERTFSSEILDSAYKPLDLTIRMTASAIEKYVKFVDHFLESAEKHLMEGYQVNYYTFTDHPQAVPGAGLQPAQSLCTVPIKKYSHWQEISMCRMEAINRHIAETIHWEVGCWILVFCLVIATVFHNPWGAETLGEVVVALYPGYFNMPQRWFSYERKSASATFIPDGEGDFYYGGAVIGGLVKKVYDFTEMCHITILADETSGIMAAQQESHLNRYVLSHKPA
ncbi:PREDICTED: globoside alpha-1,3-N-acetylgalactosaminyltransferase 1 [Gavialis gangeticus]|uniref:globoside alpha-1,3-N-acetylgalactosaminyltransferase 1 n=1 Tax=Gavialis gangeticus TaxID=94835 RepID=UPI00092F1C97|nr:PREDICTED: globoside alpha-1,3-N-acetylgalactosaminyltransferase 1 [Gavialis gangeticus]